MATFPHYSMICDRCGLTFTDVHQQIRPLRRLAKGEGWTQHFVDMHIEDWCPACTKRENERNAKKRA